MNHFKQYELLIEQWALKYSRSCPAADLTDLRAEGRLAYAEALTTWDPTRGMFSTHLVWKLRWFLSRWVRREVAFTRSVDEGRDGAIYDGETGELVDVPAPPSFLDHLFAELGDEARELVRVLLEGGKLPLRRNLRRQTQEIRLALRGMA